MPDPAVADLAATIERLSPADRLRLAAGLLEQRRPELAHTIAERVVVEIGAALALANLEQKGRAARAR